MVKKVISIATVFLMLCCMIPFGAFADDILDVCPKCGERTYETWTDFSTTVPELGFPLSGKYRHCTSCGYTYYDWNCLGFAGYKDFDNGGEGFFLDYIKNWCTKTFGQNATATKAPTGIGRKDLPGYADDKGSALVDKDGWPTATYTMLLDGYDTSVGVDTVYKHSDSNNGSWFRQITGSFSGNNGNLFAYGIYDSTLGYRDNLCASVSYYYIAPVSGYYTLSDTNFDVSFSVRDSSGKYILGDKGDCEFLGYASFGQAISNPTDRYSSWYPKTDLSAWHITPLIGKQRYFSKGAIIYFSLCFQSYFTVEASYPYKSVSIKSTAPTLTVQDLTPNQITNNNNITINKNTWNGNIYVDNSTNLTYIYPQYTTINEKNETVTNISNNPIIYNNETKQYYTYNSVTNNYYYITYEQQPSTPTPSPSPSPSPSSAPTETPSPSESPAPTPTPDPGENPAPTPTPGGGAIITPGGGGSGSGSGSGSGISGGDDEGLFGWLWDLLKDLVKAILKAIFKVLSGLLGFLIWLVERVGILLPFLPAPAIAALGAGVVLVFVIRIIRFIRG